MKIFDLYNKTNAKAKKSFQIKGSLKKRRKNRHFLLLSEKKVSAKKRSIWKQTEIGRKIERKNFSCDSVL